MEKSKNCPWHGEKTRAGPGQEAALGVGGGSDILYLEGDGLGGVLVPGWSSLPCCWCGGRLHPPPPPHSPAALGRWAMGMCWPCPVPVLVSSGQDGALKLGLGFPLGQLRGPWISPKEVLGSPQWSLGPKMSPGRGSQRGFSCARGLEEHHWPCPHCGAGSQRGACSSSSLCVPQPLARAVCHPCSPGAGDGAARDAQNTLWPWLPVIYAPGRRPGPESAAWPPALGWERREQLSPTELTSG